MTIASPFPDVQIPDLSVYDFLFGTVEAADQDSIAIVDTAEVAPTTYKELMAAINAFAGAFTHRVCRTRASTRKELRATQWTPQR